MHATARLVSTEQPAVMPPAASPRWGDDIATAFRQGLLAASQRPLTARARRRLDRLMTLERRIGKELVDSEDDFERRDAELAAVERALETIERPYIRQVG